MKEFVRKVSVIVDFLPFPILNKNDNNVNILQMSNEKKVCFGYFLVIHKKSERSHKIPGSSQGQD
jgi:hypothetical protein